MQARMRNPAMVVPDAMEALQALGKASEQGGVPKTTLELVHLRASQINGCSVCVDMHAREREEGAARRTSGCSPSRPGARRRTSPTPNAPHWR